ncbi:MAG: ribosomal protein L7/L12 [Chloroflexota bacterium]
MVSESDIAALRARINELEDRLKFIYSKLEIEYPEKPDPIMAPKIQDALRHGNKIEAIKIYRELTGVGLAEAKDVIDKAERSIT